MALSPTQQTLELIKRSRAILVAFRQEWTGDAIAAGLALAQALEKMGKNVDVVCQDFRPKPSLSFLPLDKIKNQLKNLQKFVVSVDTAQIKVGEFYYDREDGRLNFYITPEEGKLQDQNVTTAAADFKYDLIFLLNTPDLESLGDVYKKNSDFFFATPKINLDHSNKNEHYGDINLTDLSAASTSEIVYQLVKDMDERLIDENIATSLLAGVISATKNFKTAEVTPRTLNLAGLLIASGARREQIIQNLYQTRFLSTLKLWGRILSRLNSEDNGRVVWSTISRQDFLETSTTPEEVADVVEELIATMPKTEIIALIYENSDLNKTSIDCLLYSVKSIDSREMAKRFNSEGNADLAKFSLFGKSLVEAEREIVEEINNFLKKI